MAGVIIASHRGDVCVTRVSERDRDRYGYKLILWVTGVVQNIRKL